MKKKYKKEIIRFDVNEKPNINVLKIKYLLEIQTLFCLLYFQYTIVWFMLLLILKKGLIGVVQTLNYLL